VIEELPDPAVLTAIEASFWTPGGRLPSEADVVVRGSPITAEKLWTHAVRQAREYSYRGEHMASVSVDVVLPEWPLDRILAAQLATYSRYAIFPVAAVVEADFELLATGAVPHADVVFPAVDSLWAERLATLLAGSEQRNPYKSRR
jgi:hypothetical protein